MALGGGTFTTQNKVLPGAYINFISAQRAGASLSDRGVATIGLELSWGAENTVIALSRDTVIRNALKIFGYEYNNEKLKGIRELFRSIKTLYLYRLNTGAKSSNAYATALYSGVRGNDIKIVIRANVDDSAKFDVITMLGEVKVDEQTVGTSADLVANDFVTFKTATLTATAGTALTGGTDGDAVTGENHTTFLNTIESYAFNAIGCIATTDEIKGLYVAFVKRMREAVGAKFQAVLYQKSVDYEGVVSVENSVDLVPWVTGVIASCAINKSNTNKIYDGEYEVSAAYTQLQLEDALKAGKFIFHKVGDQVRVLEDINTLTTFTNEKNEDFKSNQTIRVLDQIAMDIATIFNNKYLGSIPNNASGHISLWSDIVSHHRELEKVGAIEGFSPDDVKVNQGDTKKSVAVSDVVTVVNAMAQLYMNVVVQ